ncbi:hypothetical protein Tco_0432936, partial [Tanacetum coccineum]
MELELEIKVPGLECNRKPQGVPFAFQRMSDIIKVRVDALLTYLVVASNITTPENTRFCLKLRKLIAEHLDQEKLQSKKIGRTMLMTSNNVYFIASFIPLIMEYLVNISKRRAFWSLNADILKITILKTNTPYPSRKIR